MRISTRRRPRAHCGPAVYILYRVRRAATARPSRLAPLPCPQGGRGRRREASGEPFGPSGAPKTFPLYRGEKPLAGKEIINSTTSVQNQLSHPKSTRMPGINRSKSHARGQKHCLWGCAGLWRGLWSRSQRLFPSPGRYVPAEGAFLFKTNGPTSAGLAPPGHRMARKRLQCAPLAGTQALGGGQLLFMYRVSVGFSVGPISAF